MNLRDYREYFKGTLDSLCEEEVNNLTSFFEHNLHKQYFIIGNGGSATLASHLAQDLTKQCGVNALSLTDSVPLLTAFANDTDYNNVFIGQLNIRSIHWREDVLIAISGSGGSANIINAVLWAKANKMWTIGLSGYRDNELSKIADISVCVRLNDMETVESVFSFIFHYLVLKLGKLKD